VQAASLRRLDYGRIAEKKAGWRSFAEWAGDIEALQDPTVLIRPGLQQAVTTI
jgi:hypothetical protein